MSRSDPPVRPTIHDVARRAGVAASTVSRAFSHPDRLRPDTRQHVLDVAAALHYRPNPVARALPRGRTSTLALLVPDITNPFFFDLVRGAGQQAAAAGYTLVLADTGEIAGNERTHVDRLTGAVDGFVLASSRLSDEELGELARGRRAVAVNRTLSTLPCVAVDNKQGMRQAAEHLRSLGHTSIAYLAGPPASWSNRARQRALQAAGRQLGLTVLRLGPFTPTVDAGAAAADAALAAGVTAVVAFNDLLAIGTLRRFAARGVDVPGRLSVVGWDDIFGADFCHPPLTTVSADIELVGRRAVDLLLSAVDNSTVDSGPIVVPSQLRIRDSTGPVR